MKIVIITLPRSGSTLLVELIKAISDLTCRSELFRYTIPSARTGKNTLAPEKFFRETSLGVDEYLENEFGNHPYCFKVMIEQLILQPKVFVALAKTTDHWIFNRRRNFSDATVSMYVKRRKAQSIRIPYISFVVRTLLHRLEYTFARLVFRVLRLPCSEVVYEEFAEDPSVLEKHLQSINTRTSFSVLSAEDALKSVNVKKGAFGNKEDIIRNLPQISLIKRLIR